MFVHILLISFLVSGSAFAQKIKGTVELLESTTLFSSPGIDSWETGQGRGVAWPKAGTVLQILDSKLEGPGRYFLVTYKGDKKPSLHKWIVAGHPSLGILKMSSPSSPSPRPRPPTPTRIAPKSPAVEYAPRASAPAVTKPPPRPKSVILPDTEGTLKEYVRDLTEVSSNHPVGLRSVTEISQYMGSPHAYLSTYKPILSKVAEHFDISEEFMTCLLYQESKWERTARSRTGARGLAQMTGGARQTINAIIGGEMSEKEREDLQAILDSPRGKSQKDLTYAQKRLENHALKEMWVSYFEARGVRPPTSINADNPEHALPGAALYIRFMIDSTLQNLPNKTVEIRSGVTTQDVFDFHLVLAAGYNAGHGVMINAIKNVQPSQPSLWVAKMEKAKSNGETKAHMDKISSCMERPGEDREIAPGTSN